MNTDRQDLWETRRPRRNVESKYISGLVRCNTSNDIRINSWHISSGSDVPIHLYSFSFNLNPDWSQELADQEEVLQC
jgi:hypothetical protein